MSLAQQITHGTRTAGKRPGVVIPEIEIAQGTLDNSYDVHFGINSQMFDGVLNLGDSMQSELQGLGPRILDIKNRGGRTAEDSWFILVFNTPRRRRGGTLLMPGYVAQDARKPIKAGKDVFPPGARRFEAGGVQDVAGQSKGYQPGATHKSEVDMATLRGREQYGTRWSKAALELALSHAGKRIHFHLDGMGNISEIINRTGDYAYNVTARELRYLFRHWQRFQWSVIFYNGYTASGQAVIVEPPWLAEWQADDAVGDCSHCAKVFTKFTWRHHCRGCGQVFCDKCCSQKKRLAWPVKEPGKQRETDPVRLCTDCYAKF